MNRLEGIKMEKEKLKMVLDYPTSKKVKDVQKLLELTNYYRWFIKDFTTIVRLSHDLIKEEQK